MHWSLISSSRKNMAVTSHPLSKATCICTDHSVYGCQQLHNSICTYYGKLWHCYYYRPESRRVNLLSSSPYYSGIKTLQHLPESYRRYPAAVGHICIILFSFFTPSSSHSTSPLTFPKSIWKWTRLVSSSHASWSQYSHLPLAKPLPSHNVVTRGPKDKESVKVTLVPLFREEKSHPCLACTFNATNRY